MKPYISVIITTYNWPDALDAVLESLTEQSRRDFEVIITDDGSTESTQRLVDEWKKKAPFAIQHIWQEDLGFRAAKARNRGIAAAKGDLVIFVDGDCVLPPTFIEGHAKLAEKQHFVFGNRILLSPQYTEAVLKGAPRKISWGLLPWLFRRLRGDCNRYLPLLKVPGTAWRDCQPERWKGAKTCNLAVFKTDLQYVNGFDEAFVGWGFEDSDLVIRLIHAGLRSRSGKFCVPVIHLWHPEKSRANEAINLARFMQRKSSKQIQAQEGLSQLSRL